MDRSKCYPTKDKLRPKGSGQSHVTHLLKLWDYPANRGSDEAIFFKFGT